jgi:hypothetical protein
MVPSAMLGNLPLISAVLVFSAGNIRRHCARDKMPPIPRKARLAHGARPERAEPFDVAHGHEPVEWRVEWARPERAERVEWACTAAGDLVNAETSEGPGSLTGVRLLSNSR